MKLLFINSEEFKPGDLVLTYDHDNVPLFRGLIDRVGGNLWRVQNFSPGLEFIGPGRFDSEKYYVLRNFS